MIWQKLIDFFIFLESLIVSIAGFFGIHPKYFMQYINPEYKYLINSGNYELWEIKDSPYYILFKGDWKSQEMLTYYGTKSNYQNRIFPPNLKRKITKI